MKTETVKEIPLKKLNKQAKEHLEFHKRIGNNAVSFIEDEHGTLRYKPNSVMNWLSENLPLPAPWYRGFPLNELAVAYCEKEITTRDYAVFYSQLGYSLCGYEEIWSGLMDRVLKAKDDKAVKRILKTYAKQ